MAARHDDRAGGGEHTPDAAADRDLGAGDLSGGGTAHLAHAPPAIHPGMHVREAAAIRYGLKNLGFAPRGEAGRLITNGMSRSAMRFPLAARDVVWNRCELSRSARDLAKVGNPPEAAFEGWGDPRYWYERPAPACITTTTRPRWSASSGQ